MYYLVQDPETSCYVFTEDDPRGEGFRGPVQEGVHLVIPADLNEWPAGVTAPHPCLAACEKDGGQYRVFKYRNECRPAGYRPLSELYAVHRTWSEYRSELHRA